MGADGVERGSGDLETLIASLGAVDHRGVDWGKVRWTGYLVHQHLRYEYPGKVHDLRQRLVVVPPPRHGGQRLVTHKLEVSHPADVREERDAFGNLVVTLAVAEIDAAIDFTAWIVVEREAPAGPIPIPTATYADPAFRQPTRLTAPDAALEAAAAVLRADGGDPLALASRVNAWVYERMTYEHGATGVRTTAADAFALGRGVCQDYAHVMLALCRACDLPARYVSGHLLGEGGTHAWVEVMLPDPTRADRFIAYPLDPTHGTEPGLSYLTVAVGRDYGDVAPTSGTFRAPFGGQLSATKRAGLTSLEYVAAVDFGQRTEPAPPAR